MNFWVLPDWFGITSPIKLILESFCDASKLPVLVPIIFILGQVLVWAYKIFAFNIKLNVLSKKMLFAQTGQGVDIFSPIGILIIVIGVVITVGFPVAMIKFGRKSWIRK